MNEGSWVGDLNVAANDAAKEALLPVANPGSSPALKPQQYYGWVMLLIAIGLAVATNPAQTFGISIFNEPLRLELGLSHSRLALAYTLGTLCGALPIFLIGGLIDRFGLRRSTLAVVVLFSLSCAAMYLVEQWWHLVIVFALLRMLGPGSLTLLGGNILPFWFAKRLGTVEGFRQTATAMSLIWVTPINVWLEANLGWRLGYATLGSAVLLLLFPICWLGFRQFPHEVGQTLDQHEPDSASLPSPDAASLASPLMTSRQALTAKAAHEFTIQQAMQTPAFWLVVIGTSMLSLIQTAIFFCLVPILSEQGQTDALAGTLLVAYAISLTATQFIGGWLADRIAPRLQLIGGMTLFSLAVALLASGWSPLSTLLAGALMGAGLGIYVAATLPLWPRFFGSIHLGKIRGSLVATNIAFSSLGPLIAGTSRDWLLSFEPMLWSFALLPIPLLICTWWVARPVSPSASPLSPN